MTNHRKLIAALAFAAASASTQVQAQLASIAAESAVGPTVSTWGWDAKGRVNVTNTLAKATELYVDTRANLIRVPIFAPAHAQDGTVDTTKYTAVLQSIRNAKQVNPTVKVFASLKLDGVDTFPTWVESNVNGTIFGNTVKRPDPAKYSTLLADYVDYMRSQNIAIDYLGVANEVEDALVENRYINTVRQLKSTLVTRNVPTAYRSFQFIGPDTFGIPTGVDYVTNVAASNGLDTIDIGGSHAYPDQPAHTRARWGEFKDALAGRPMWHTEAHMNPFNDANGETAADNIGKMRDGMAVMFSTNMSGATGFVWWNPTGDSTNVDDVLKRKIINSTMGAYPVSTSPGFNEQATDQAAPLHQAYRSGDSLRVWIAKPATTTLANQRIDLLDTDVASATVVGTWWAGPGNDITSTNTGLLSISVAANRKSFTIASLPANSIALIELFARDLMPGDADLNGRANFDDLLRLAAAYNQTNKRWDDGDFDRDGRVNFNDLLILAANYNRVGASPNAMTLPEPATITFSLAGSCVLLRRPFRA